MNAKLHEESADRGPPVPGSFLPFLLLVQGDPKRFGVEEDRLFLHIDSVVGKPYDQVGGEGRGPSGIHC